MLEGDDEPRRASGEPDQEQSIVNTGVNRPEEEAEQREVDEEEKQEQQEVDEEEKQQQQEVDEEEKQQQQEVDEEEKQEETEAAQHIQLDEKEEEEEEEKEQQQQEVDEGKEGEEQQAEDIAKEEEQLETPAVEELLQEGDEENIEQLQESKEENEEDIPSEDSCSGRIENNVKVGEEVIGNKKESLGEEPTLEEEVVEAAEDLTHEDAQQDDGLVEQMVEKEGEKLENDSLHDQELDVEGPCQKSEVDCERDSLVQSEDISMESHETDLVSVTQEKEKQSKTVCPALQEKNIVTEEKEENIEMGEKSKQIDLKENKENINADESKEDIDVDDKMDDMPHSDLTIEETPEQEKECKSEKQEDEDMGMVDSEGNETYIQQTENNTCLSTTETDSITDTKENELSEKTDEVIKPEESLQEGQENEEVVEDMELDGEEEEMEHEVSSGSPDLEARTEELEMEAKNGNLNGITAVEGVNEGDDENAELEETPVPEECTEGDDAMEEGENEEDVDVENEVNGLGVAEPEIEDEEHYEEYNQEEVGNGSLPDSKSLPQCRLKRNYCCVHCGLNTQNPREHLYHLRDEHGEKMKVFECPRCIYASKNHQKLIRHARMVHKMKIKKLEASPNKPRSKSPGVSISPVKFTRASVSPGKSTRSSPGKSPRSSESIHDDWDEMEEEDDQDLDQDGLPLRGEDRKQYFCEQCDYTCRSRKLLNRHETSYHLKRRFFRCVKCNYVTHLKGRYTKHLKYHQLPILKCEYCDFRTPYRWNLDRHLKNHNEDCGEHKCHLCNFTAQIKQSLTVHISNHHLTTEQIREREMRRTIGISDPADCAFDDQEMELMRLERDEHPDALILPGYSAPDSPSAAESTHEQHNGSNSFRVSNIDVGSQDDAQVNADDSKDEDGEPKRKKPKIKITLKKMRVSKPKDTFFQELNERHNFEEDFIHPDDVVHRHGNVYIKTFKCRFCTFKAAFKNEVVRHEKKIHSIPIPKYMGHSKKAKKTFKSSKLRRPEVTSSDDVLAQILQFPPADGKDGSEEAKVMDALQNLSELEENSPENKDDSNNDEVNVEEEGINEQEDSNDAADDQSSDSKESSPSKDSGKKKNLSFFEKLQEKMPTSNVQNLVCQFCGHESKCLSESVRHQKLHLSAKNIYASASLSTRCQFCRHRCKTTDDLMNHLKQCPEARKNQITDSGRRASGGRVDENEDSQGSEKGDNQGEENNTDVKSVVKTPVMLSGTVLKKEDLKHPMENRVFVWNKFDKAEEQNSQDKQSVEGKEKVDKGNRRNSTENKRKSSGGAKSPVQTEGALDYYIESPTPQGHHYYSKRVYRCPQCSFWATTASRFHVHIVGHFNRKPYNCSECGYKSNWRWDITKHIKLKTSRDSSHQNAQVIITDETGEKNYEKYDCYLAIIQLDETNAHRTEGGIPTRKGRPKRTPEKEEVLESITPTASPIRKPPMVAIPVIPRLQAMPPLTRAPGRSASSRPGSMPFGPILPGAQLMVQLAGKGAGGTSSARPPPPLTLKGTFKSSASSSTSSGAKTAGAGDPIAKTLSAGGQYQIITPQMRFLAWLNLLMTDAEEQVSVLSTGEDGKEVARMVLDHEGNPEWKCNTCDFRDSEQETVVQHVRLAHTRNGPVSLLHAVHRCDVCGYAAGTKRAVQLHIDSSHGGQGGITSRCEGQNPDTKEPGDAENAEYNENARTYHCRLCPFTCKKRTEMKPHLAYHTERSDCIFKCMFCPYYVPTRSELFDHLRVHGMEVPSSIIDSTNKAAAGGGQDDTGGPRQFACGSCPFETRSRAKLMHHRQFHKPKGLPFRCPHCTYNVTRRHLLSQHIRVHGLEDGLEGQGTGDVSHIDDRSNSPSPSLTITPVTNATSGTTGGESALTDSSQLPKLTDDSTMLMEDIPLVWVSRDHRFFKMFKCRHCPHVNLRKTNIQEHEKMHKTDISKEAGGLHCPYCSYVSVNAGVMSAHLKVHGGSMGQCHAVVDSSLSDEEQLKQLTSKTTSSNDPPQSQPAADEATNWKTDEKVLYYCQHCPARFFLEKEIQIHSRFHNTNLPHTCDHCNYGTRQPAHLLTHLKVHTPEYQQRTRTMMNQHRTASPYPPVPGLTIPHDMAPDQLGEKQATKEAGGSGRPFSASPPPSGIMPQPPPTSKYMCDQCPASFSKLVTLQYHQSLHGTKNPHQCPRCSYAGKTSESLQQHLQLHSQHDQAEKAANESAKKMENQKASEASLKSKIGPKSSDTETASSNFPPIKLKLIGLRPETSETTGDGTRPQFKYYVEEQVPLSGVDLLRRKTQLEKEGYTKDGDPPNKAHILSKNKLKENREENEEEDPKRIGDPKLYYPLHIDRVTGKSREKRYKCSKCPSAFEKIEQYNVHSNLHGSNHKYHCRICDYSVKFFANFMMHINRHKYHEKMEAQTNGLPPPVDTDGKYEPVISRDNSSQGDKGVRNRTDDHSNKENLEDADLTTIERQHLLLQNKKGVGESSKKDEEKERRVYYCQYCPYANIRRDAVDSHSLRHRANGGFGSYRCTFCDYTASQPNFIREHTKVHFRPFKYVHPEGFMRHDRQEILSIPLVPGGRTNVKPKKDGDSPSLQEKYKIYSNEMGLSNSPLVSDCEDEEEEENVDPQMVESIRVNFHSGDIVEAPHDFVISLRPSKSKVGHFQAEPNEVACTSSEISEKADNLSMEINVQSGDTNIEQVTDQASVDDENMEVEESFEVNKKVDEPEITNESSSPCDENTMETESYPEAEKLQNGHAEEEPQGSEEPEESPETTSEGKGNLESTESKLSEVSPVEKNMENSQSKKLSDSH